jgi:2-oxoglutarate ferredoxin oxidoreductase subunit delta
MSNQLNRQGFLPAVFPEECNRDCTSCALCAQMCPDVAITVFRDEKGANHE